MASQAKAKGRKIGRWQRKPTNVRYKAENRRDKNKQRRITRAANVMIESRERKGDERTTETTAMFPGWDYRGHGYGWIRV